MSYQDWTLLQLKSELKTRGAKQSGRKQDLVARLQFQDATKATVSEPPLEVEFSMVLPHSSSYKDIHGGMVGDLPNVTQSRVEEYLRQFDKKLEDKSKSLYKERYLRSLRSANDDDKTFLASVVWAEMKKAASYRVDISLNRDGVVQEAQCECGAGQGPTAHCKHVGAVLHGFTSFLITGNIVTELTCTQVLQTFHKAKAFKGSPMKSEELQIIRGKENAELVYDPRPVHLRNEPGSEDRLRNSCLNFMHKDKPMPVLQLFEPANPHAIVLDHDYLKLPADEQYLIDNLISRISEEQAMELEVSTRGQSTNKKWQAVRSQHLTSSHFGSICKATDRRNMVALCKTITEHVDLRSAPILHGRKYENTAIEIFEKKWDIVTKPCGIFVSTVHPQLGASPDRVIDDTTIVEVKCPYTARDMLISPHTVPYLFECDGVKMLKQTHDYYFQIQGQLFCSNRKECFLIIYTFKDLVVVNVKRNDSFIDSMLEKLLQFYTNHFRSSIINKFLYKDYFNYSF